MKWSTACPDWERRIVARESLIPHGPLFPDQAAEALEVFGQLRMVDATGSPLMCETVRPWVNEFVAAISQYFVAGNIGLTLGLLNFGGATLHDLTLSAGATLPAYAGLWVGQRIQARLDERRFAALLYVLYLATGASFLTRAIG